MAMGRLILAALLAIPVAAASSHDESWCGRVTYQGGSIEMPCEGKPGSASGDAWWTSSTAQAVYAVLGLGLSAAGGGYAYVRVRARRRALASFMTRIDGAVAAGKASPSEGAASLAALRAELRAAFDAHRVDDAHFLELDKRAISGLAKLRALELDARAPGLPLAARAQLVSLLSDGLVTDAEVQLARSALAAHPMPAPTRDAAASLLLAWAEADTPNAAPRTVPILVAPPPPPPPPPLVRLRE
ncbi:MAG TPA: hypothetical protein VHH36_07150 [Candidatus Thermoplasmatota archaeon]|nr:hypothetical protein [Candidatus Thermoplasmatota archaeon]